MQIYVSNTIDTMLVGQHIRSVEIIYMTNNKNGTFLII